MSSRIPVATAVAPADRKSVLRGAALALAGSLVLAVSAHVAVPFWPVPMTLQTLAVLLIGGVFGPVVGAASVLAYVAEGLAGLPVFSHGGGVAALTGPTFGYIVGFLPAAVLAALAARQPRGAAGLIGAAALMLAAAAVILACGTAWLASLIGAQKAVAAGLMPFLLGEALKVALATTAVRLRAAPADRARR